MDIWDWEQEWSSRLEVLICDKEASSFGKDCKYPDYCDCQVCAAYVDIGGEG